MNHKVVYNGKKKRNKKAARDLAALQP